jgi:hypothetical protein
MELENHTFTHNGLYRCSDEEMAQEVYMQQLALSHILGVEYQCHFLRPKGGDARRDQRMQVYAEQLGCLGGRVCVGRVDLHDLSFLSRMI